MYDRVIDRVHHWASRQILNLTQKPMVFFTKVLGNALEYSLQRDAIADLERTMREKREAEKEALVLELKAKLEAEDEAQRELERRVLRARRRRDSLFWQSPSAPAAVSPKRSQRGR